MIDILLPFISNEQIDEISRLIQRQFLEYQRLANTSAFQRLFREEYQAHERQHSISWALKSAFPSDSIIAGLRVSCMRDGGGYRRPELRNANIIIHILSDKTKLQSKYLREKYALNENGFELPPVYCYFRVSAQDSFLKSLVLCVPDSDGEIIAEETLYERPRIEEVGA